MAITTNKKMKYLLLLCLFLIKLSDVVPVVIHTGSENMSSSFATNFLQDIYKWPRLSEADHYNVLVNADDGVAKLNHFWKSTGLCPPDPHQESYKFLLSKDMHQNLGHIGSLPHNGITQVRIHWLLDLVQMRVNENKTVSYNFTHLDELVNKLWLKSLKPGFELMGNPSQIFSDFENVTQVYLWRDLVKTLAVHYIDFYGIQYMSQWNFETWNEPDHHDFDRLNFTTQGFLNYYDACSEGLKLANKLLILGGPGGSCHTPNTGFSPLCWELMRHCISGRNFFTGESGVRLDFISFHKKGNGSSVQILREEIETIEYISKHFPSIIHLPFYNDEADPLKSWSRPEWWRADATYAAIVVKVVVNHVQFYYIRHKQKNLESINFMLLSNDNAFLSYFPNQFTQRTLLARFQVNNTNPSYIQFVRKPVYAAMGLLSKLCQTLLDTKVYKNGRLQNMMGHTFNALATSCKLDRTEIIVIMHNSMDTKQRVGTAYINLTVNYSFSNASNIKWALFEVNNAKTNPYAVWKMMGAPAFPTTKQFSLIKEQEEPFMVHLQDIQNTPPWHFHFKISRPGVSLLNICAKSNPPMMVENVELLKITNTTLQIFWQDNRNRCLLTYIVEYSNLAEGRFVKVNQNPIRFPSFWYACTKRNPDCKIEGFYRIQAVDYWNVHGPFTEPVLYRM